MNTHSEFTRLAAAAVAVIDEENQGYVVGDDVTTDPEEFWPEFEMVDMLVKALRAGEYPNVWLCSTDGMAEDVTDWAYGQARRWFDIHEYPLDEIPEALKDDHDRREAYWADEEAAYLATQPYR